MAFINKLFPSRNRKTSIAFGNNNKCQNNNTLVRDDLFTFAVEQVQVAVFRECDFRGRKLLFDSKSVVKVQLENNNTTCNGTDKNHLKENERNQHDYVETTNGYGYLLTKPTTELCKLPEMIFGSVAMAFRGTLYKIHTLTVPPRIVFSQVFPSPRIRNSAANQSSMHTTTTSMDQSIRFDDSAGSGGSQASYSDQSTSDQLSTASDTLLICRRRQQSVPLDVPLNSSLISSSGYGGELSTSSISSGPQSMPMDLSDCGKLSTSFSETFTHRSLPTTMCLGDDIRGLRHRRGSKLGLAIILQLNSDQEKNLENYLMHHIAYIETVLWRVRQSMEIAYIHHQTFVSTMYDISNTTAQWFVNLLTNQATIVSEWSRLRNCDIPISIKCDTKHLLTENCYNYSNINNSDFGAWRTLTKRFFRSDKGNNLPKSVDNCEHMEGFIKDLCELVEHFDVKHNNFFLSTLMTGILTHHLGWVATILPQDEIKCERSKNPLVQQLCDLYGCMGYPSKIAHTIITGNNQEGLISKFINVLTYFIRCSEVKNITYQYDNIDNQTTEVDRMCDNTTKHIDNNIPIRLESNDNFKTTTDIRSRKTFHNLVTNHKDDSFQFNGKNEIQCRSNGNLGPMGIKKSRTCLGDLNKMEEMTKEVDNQNDSDGIPNKVDPKVLFVLGENEKLERISLHLADTKGDQHTEETRANGNSQDIFDDSDFISNNNSCEHIKASSSCINLKSEGAKPKRAHSEEPSLLRPNPKTTENKTGKYRYAGVKFNFQQYPQIFENYMKSKNIELSEMHMQEKKEFVYGQKGYSNINFSKYNDIEDSEDDEPLQTPSNATELEFTSDLAIALPPKAKAKEIVEYEKQPANFTRCALSNTLIVPEVQDMSLQITELPMPLYKQVANAANSIQFTKTLLRPTSYNYVPNVALQGIINPPKDWQSVLKRDLILSAKHPISGAPVEETIAIIGNIDSWKVNVISSHTYVIDKAVGGVPIGMSQLVANMLETLLKMWKLRTPPEYCLMHIEQKLREFCMQSKALAQMLLDTEYCTIELLTSALKLEVNDVPLLMAVASIHTPEVTQKYGLRFQ